jgi:ElaB/YqjD/DUF883 family membrane-anchored ribosome-binding protein
MEDKEMTKKHKSGAKYDVETLRKEAIAMIQEDEDNLVMRSCWECNGAHEFLKRVDNFVILCPWCGHYYYKGVKITEE